MNQDYVYKLRASIGDPAVQQAQPIERDQLGLKKVQGGLGSTRGPELPDQVSEIGREIATLDAVRSALEFEFEGLKGKLVPVMLNVPHSTLQNEPEDPSPESDLGLFLRSSTVCLRRLRDEIVSLKGRLAL